MIASKTPETPQVGPEPVQLGRYKYFYFNQRNDVTSLLKHNGQSLHSYLYDEYGQLYDQPSHKASAGKLSKNASNFTDTHNYYNLFEVHLSKANVMLSHDDC